MTDLRRQPTMSVAGATTTEEYVRAVAQGAQIPHRLASDPSSPYYHPFWSHRIAQVRWNGVVLKDVLEFDVKAGWVEQMVRSPVDRTEVMVAGIAYPRRRYGKIDVDFRIPV